MLWIQICQVKHLISIGQRFLGLKAIPDKKKTPLQPEEDGLKIPHEPLPISKCSVQPCTTKNQRWFLKEMKFLVFDLIFDAPMTFR